MENVDFSFDSSSRTMTFVFRGRLNSDTCTKNDPDIESAIDRILKENPPQTVSIIFDIGQVDYVSSLFLRVVIMAARKVAKGKFKLTGATPLVRKMIEISGLDRLIFEPLES